MSKSRPGYSQRIPESFQGHTRSSSPLLPTNINVKIKVAVIYFLLFVRVWNFVCQTGGETRDEGALEQGVEEDIGQKTQEVTGGWVEKITVDETSGACSTHEHKCE
jgi:hypothetical protein